MYPKLSVEFFVEVKWVGWFVTEKKYVSKGICCTPAFGSIIPPAGSLIDSCCKVEALCKEVLKEPNFEGSLYGEPRYQIIKRSPFDPNFDVLDDVSTTGPEDLSPELKNEIDQLIERYIKDAVELCGSPEQTCPGNVEDGKCEKPPEGAYTVMGSKGILPGGAQGVCTWDDYVLTETREYDEPAPPPPPVKQVVHVPRFIQIPITSSGR